MRYDFIASNPRAGVVELTPVDEPYVCIEVRVDKSLCVKYAARNWTVQSLDGRIKDRLSIPEPKQITKPDISVHLDYLDVMKVKIYRHIREHDIRWGTVSCLLGKTLEDDEWARNLLLLSSHTSEDLLSHMARVLRIDL